MNLQSIIVIAIVIICILYVGHHIINYFKSVKKGENPCASCPSGCELHQIIEKKKQRCIQNSVKKNKNRRK